MERPGRPGRILEVNGAASPEAVGAALVLRPNGGGTDHQAEAVAIHTWMVDRLPSATYQRLKTLLAAELG